MLQKFRFEAVTKEGKNMAGSIQANSKDEAREKLTKSGLAILALEDYKMRVKQAGMQVFNFEAINSEKKHIKGTIEAMEEYAAYKKLRTEYDLEISSLLLQGLPMEERIAKKKQGIDPSFEKRLQEDLEEEAKSKETKKSKRTAEDEINEVLAARKKEIEFMHGKIDEVLGQVNELIKTNERFLNHDSKRKIQDRIDLLSRLRRSNSVMHLQKLTKKVLKELTDDALFLKEEELKEEDKEAWLASKSEFFQMGQNLEMTVDKGLAEIQSLITKLEEMGVQETIREMRPVEKFFSILFFTFATIFSLCIVFWAWIFLQGISGLNPGMTSFYLHSGLMWYTTAVSIILLVGLTVGMFFDEFQTLPKRLLLGAGVVGILLFVTFEFPLIFYWV